MSGTYVVDMGNLEQDDESDELEPLTSPSDERLSSLGDHKEGPSTPRQHALVAERAPTDIVKQQPAEIKPSPTSKTKHSSFTEDLEQLLDTPKTRTPEEELFLAVLDRYDEMFQSILKEGLAVDLINKKLNTKVITANDQNEHINLAFAMPYRRAKNAFMFSCEYSCTTLHFTAAFALYQYTRQLLAAGADPNVCDGNGRTVLDVVGTGLYYVKSFELQLTDKDMSNFPEVIRLIHQHGGQQTTMRLRKNNLGMTTPLHTAALLTNMAAFKELIELGAHPGCFNYDGETPLHVCVKTKFEEPFNLLDKTYMREMSKIIDLTESRYGTVLQKAIWEHWRPGVNWALVFGADVTKLSLSGDAPIHTAAILQDLDILNDILYNAVVKNGIDCKNKRGETVLFLAVTYRNVASVEAILQVQARDYMLIDKVEGMNVLHVAAENGDEKILRLMFDSGQVRIKALQCLSITGFGPLHYAVAENNIDCVQLLLFHNRVLVGGRHNLYGPMTADECSTGDPTIIRLKTGKDESSEECRSHAPPKKSKKKERAAEGSTPLHIAAMYNHTEIAALLLKDDKTLIHEKNTLNELPLHTAIVHSSRDVTKVLIKNGASFTSCLNDPDGTRRTAIEMLINNLSDPQQFLNDVFDSYILPNNKNLDEPDCVVEIDYSTLMTNEFEIISTSHEPEKEQMKILQALLNTGNRYKQQSLLLHPLVESFLHLKWNALLPFFYTIIALYASFLISLTFFSYSVFYYRDTNDTSNNEEQKPVILNTIVWAYIMYFFMILITLQESLLTLQLRWSVKRLVSGLRQMSIRRCLEQLQAGLLLNLRTLSTNRCLQLLQFFSTAGVESWTKWASIGMAFILPFSTGQVELHDAQWPRNLATFALPMAWIHMMILISRFPSLGYYVLMFGRVSRKVIKILLTFSFLLFGFSIGFAIQFRFQTPFDGPVSAFIKTLIMMTSEFDYGSIFDDEHSKQLENYQVTARIIFTIFVVLTAIVLMNLMVGVAVSDTNILERDGHIQRLKRQIRILVVLENFAKDYPSLTKFFTIEKGGNIDRVITLSPGKKKAENDKILPKEIQDNIFVIAQANYKRQRDIKDGETGKRKEVDIAEVLKVFNDKIEEIAKQLFRRHEIKSPAFENASAVPDS